MTKNSQKYLQRVIHLSVWLYVLVTPMLFRGPREHFDLLHYLRGCIMPVLAIVVFYINYLILVKRYYITRRWMQFIGYNALAIIVALAMQEALMHTIFQQLIPSHGEFASNARPTPHIWFVALFSLRGFLTYTFMVVTAVAVRLSLIWHTTEMDRQKAELQNLKSQINPHFLLNTLNNIYALTAFDTDKARQALEQLSRMLRYMLYEDSSRPVKLLSEIDFLQQYIDLQRLRVGDNVDIQLQLQLPPNCVHEVMPNIFVSLVENAFKHGVSATGRSFIHVSCIHGDDGTITFGVRNSNYPKKKEEKLPGGIGLQQVARRLELLYPGRYDWTYGPSADGSTYEAIIVLYP